MWKREKIGTMAFEGFVDAYDVDHDHGKAGYEEAACCSTRAAPFHLGNCAGYRASLEMLSKADDALDALPVTRLAGGDDGVPYEAAE